MFLNFQTQADIRKITLQTMLDIGKPCTTREVADWVWNRCLVDGFQTGVRATIAREMYKMAKEDLITIDQMSPSPIRFKIRDLLTVMSLLAE